MENLNEAQLKRLHSDFIAARDKNGGSSEQTVGEFYKNNSKNYESVSLNQCDGCQRRLPVISGLHRDENGGPVMTCTAGLYA